jgi:tRNA A37 threonylcarbamoyladenosine dehydratase
LLLQKKKRQTENGLRRHQTKNIVDRFGDSVSTLFHFSPSDLFTMNRTSKGKRSKDSRSRDPKRVSSAMLNAAIYERTQILVGDVGVRRLNECSVFLAGCGGVGGHCAEALARAGIGRITLCDHDVVSATNKNRQLIALDSTIGRSKVEELSRRLRDVNAHCITTAIDAFLLPEDMEGILTLQRYDYIIDCIDSVECKVALLKTAVRLGLRVYSSCGAGGRLDPSLVSVGDLFETENDALARICRSEMRKAGVGPGSITVVHSSEKGLPPLEPQRQEAGGRDRAINGSISYMPPLFGLMLASAVIRHAIDPDAVKAAEKKRLKVLRKRLEVKKEKFGSPKATADVARRDKGPGSKGQMCVDSKESERSNAADAASVS